MRTTIAFFLFGVGLGIILSSLSSCGGGAGSSTPKSGIGYVVPTPGPNGSLIVNLNDDWNVVFPSDTYTTVDPRGFVPPTEILIVQGNALCWNGTQFLPCVPGQKNLRARLKIGSAVCEYSTPDVNAALIPLISCTGVSVGGTNALSVGTLIELDNYDAPGQLLEVQFILTP